MVNLQKSRVWSCQSLHIPQQPKGPCCATAEVKGKPLLPAAGAAPQKNRVPMCWADASECAPLPPRVGHGHHSRSLQLLHSGGCHSLQGTSLLSTPHSLPICLNVYYSLKKMGKWEGPEMRTASRRKRYERGQLEKEGRSRGGDCFNPSFFIKQKNKWSQVAYVIMMNNIQSTCIAIIIKHVFVVQVKI